MYELPSTMTSISMYYDVSIQVNKENIRPNGVRKIYNLTFRSTIPSSEESKEKINHSISSLLTCIVHDRPSSLISTHIYYDVYLL